MNKLKMLLAAWALFWSATSVSYAQPGTATAHDGSSIYFEVHGTGDKFLFLSLGTTHPRAIGAAPGLAPPEGAEQVIAAAKQAYIDGLGSDYRLIFIEYLPSLEPRMFTMTPGAVARDYLAIADAAGAEEFAYAGFSIGCVTGLQLALRTDRMKALVCGGFPTIDGIYDDMRLLTKTMIEGPTNIYGNPSPAIREFAQPVYTYYQGLRSFDDRAIQGALKMPRLSWIGDADQPTMNGKPLTHMGKLVMRNKPELEALGWDVQILPGRNHLDALAPRCAGPGNQEVASQELPLRPLIK